MEPDELLAYAKAALERGADPAAVDARLAELTNGRYGSVAALEKRPSAVNDFGRTALHQTLLGGSDEIAGLIASVLPGGRTGQEARDGVRADLQRINEERPGVATAGRVAGIVPAALIPGAAGASAARGGAGLLGTIGRGAAVSAAEGGLFGALEAEGGIAERAGPAAAGATIAGAAGGLLGGAGGIVSAMTRRASGRGARVADALEETTGTRANINAARDANAAGVQAARQAGYAPLEQTVTEITDPDVLSVLRSPTVRSHTRVFSADIASGKANPSFEDAQSVLIRLRRLNGRDRQFKEEIGQLEAALTRAVPGYREADAAYGAAKSLERALTVGQRSWNKSAADIDFIVRGLQPDEVAQFNQGRMHEITRRLRANDEGVPAVLKSMMDAGPETTARLRSLFPGDAAFDAFKRELAREQSSAKILEAARRLMIPAAAIAGIGAAGSMGASLLP